jgi:general secretion pathway protein K
MTNYKSKKKKTRQGMALLLVIAMIAILTPIILHFNTTSLEKLRLAKTISSRTQASYLAEGGILLALHTLSRDQRAYFIMPHDNPLNEDLFSELPSDFEKALLWIDESTVTPKSLGNGTVSILILDEAGKISLNKADIDLIAGGIQSAGITVATTSEILREEKDVDMSREMAAAIVDWRDPDENEYSGIGAETSWYSRQAQPINSKNSFIESLGELKLIRYFEKTELEKWNLDKFFTPWGTNGRINMNTASPEVIRSIPGIYGLEEGEAFSTEMVAKRPFKTVNEIRETITSLSPSIWNTAGKYMWISSKRFMVRVKARANNVDAIITTVVEKRGSKFATLSWKEY